MAETGVSDAGGGDGGGSGDGGEASCYFCQQLLLQFGVPIILHIVISSPRKMRSYDRPPTCTKNKSFTNLNYLEDERSK